MKKQLWLGILLIGVFLINFAGQGELTCHYNLSGQLSSLYRKELVVNFSHDMVALGGKRDGTKIVSLTPVVAGEFLWRGTKTLVFKPKTRFNYSTTYSLKIKKGTRSRQGQVLKKSRSWTFTTPLAYPAQFRCQSQRYYRNIRNNGSYEYGVGHKDNLFIKFNQTVTPVQVKKYLFFKENKFGKAEKLEVEKRSSREMIIKFIKPLSRETPYLMVLKRGFPGLEGNRGTAEDFKYEFNTIPNFRFTSPPNRIIFIDGRDMNLHFTNSLKTVLKDQVRVYKFAPGEKKTFSDFSLSTRNKYVYLRFGKSIKSGDAFVVVLDKRISNIYNEILGKEIEVKVGVCSSKKPTIGHYLNSGGLTIDSKSIEDYRVQLFHFKPKFYNFITQFQPTQVRSGRIRDYTRNFRRRYRNSFYSGHRKGCLVEKDFYDLYVKTNKSFVKHAEIDGINRHNLSFRQILGEACGFYGALVDRALPYNICNNRDTKFFWNYYQPYLDVFHKRNIEFLVQIFPRQSLILAYNKHTLQPLAAAPMIFARPGKNLFTKTTNTRGLVDVDQRLESDQWIRINNPDQAQDFSFLKLNYSVRDKNNLISTKPVLTIFTDRMYYLPGDTVHLGGVIKEMEYGQLNKPGLSSALIRVRGPDRKEVKSWTVKLDQWGGFYTSFKSDPQGKKGEYDFTVQYKKENANVWAKIDYYQPNKLKVEISKVKDRYSWKDSFKALVTGTYLSGNPMANDKLKYGLYCHASGYLSGFFENKKLAEYTFTLDSKFTKGVLELSKEAKFDGSGRFPI